MTSNERYTCINCGEENCSHSDFVNSTFVTYWLFLETTTGKYIESTDINRLCEMCIASDDVITKLLFMKKLGLSS